MAGRPAMERTDNAKKNWKVNGETRQLLLRIIQRTLPPPPNPPSLAPPPQALKHLESLGRKNHEHPHNDRQHVSGMHTSC